MPRNLLVISANEKIAETVKEVLKKIYLNIATNEPERAQEISDLGKGPDPRFLQTSREGAPQVELLILDESSFDSRQAAFKAGETFRKKRGFTVLLLTSQPVEESEKRLLLEAADASFDVSAIRDNRDLLIRLLYRRFRGAETLPRDAQVVWKLMEARAGAILLGTLFRLLSETTVPALVTTAEYRPEQLAVELDSQFLELTRNDKFSSVLASRLLAELPPLFWVYTVQSLISRGKCELESFGTFEKNYDFARLLISFDAGSVVSRLMMPDMDFSGEGLDSLAIQICGQNAIPYLYELATVEARGEIVASLFARAIRDISDSVVTLENVTAQKLSAEDIWGPQWRLNSWLGVLARATAVAEYYALAVSIGRAIHDSGKKEVPEVGTFLYDGRKIKFEASANLIELIEANPQVATAGAGA